MNAPAIVTAGGLVLACLLPLPAGSQTTEPKPGELSASMLSLPDGPGSIAGLTQDPEVDLFTGQIRYRVDFELPSGPAGFTPGLGLTYDGSLGNGPVGVGWSVGVPRIERDTRLGVPSYDDAQDTFVLAGVPFGGELVPVGGDEYRVFARGNEVRVQFDGTSATVWDKDGNVYELGTSSASRRSQGPLVDLWSLAVQRDVAGQVIVYDYVKDAGQLYLQSVSWGPGAVFEALFDYAAARPDAAVSYRSGFRVQTAQRLQAVEVYSHGEVLRTYHLEYDDRLPLSRLEQVRMTGRGGALEQPPTSFEYGARTSGAVLQVTDTDGLPATGAFTLAGSAGDDTALVDVDGDGLPELTRFGAGEPHSFLRNLGETIPGLPQVEATPTQILGAPDRDLAVMQLVDVTGNARPELLESLDWDPAVGGPSWRAVRLAEDAWGQPEWVDAGSWLVPPELELHAPNQTLADIDGDGRADVLSSPTSQELLYYQAGDGFIGSALPILNPLSGRPGQPGVWFQDLTGDGLADAAERSGASILVVPGRGDGTFDGAGAYVIDVPGLLPSQDVHLSDLNRDGVADVAIVSGTQVQWFPVRPDGVVDPLPPGQDTLTLPPAAATPEAEVRIVDFNGNGSQDVLWSTASGLWVADLAGSTSAGMLVAIDNGLGQRIEIDYTSSALLASAAAQDPEATTWTDRLPVSIPVPIEVRISLASGGPDRVVRRSVRDGFWDGEERRFGGFLIGEQVHEGDDATSTLHETHYFLAGRGDERVLRGKAVEIERRDGSGALLTRTLAGWGTVLPTGLPASEPGLRMPVKASEEVWHYEGGAQPVKVRTDYAYDGQGNLAREWQSGRLDRQGDESFVERVFAHDDTTWVRGRLVSERVRNRQGGTLLSATLWYYDGGASGPLPGGQVTEGRPREVRRYLASEKRWITVEAQDYDAVGNPVRMVREGRTTFAEWDAAGLRQIAEWIEPSPGVELRWEVEYDDVTGLPVRMQDPNGVVTVYGHDALGRLVSSGLEGQAPALSYAYDLTGPRPAITTTWKDLPLATRATVQVLDSRGEPLYVATSAGASKWIISDWVERGARGEVVERAEPFYWSAQALPTALPGWAERHSERFDALGRSVETTFPDGTSQVTLYGPLERVQLADGLGPVTIEVDGLGRIVRNVREVDGVEEITEVQWDAAGRMTKMSLDGGAVSRLFKYDSLGRVVLAFDPDIGKQNLTWTDAGRIAQVKSSTGETMDFSYDQGGRLVEKWASDGTRYVFHYDAPFSLSQAELYSSKFHPGLPGASHLAGRLAWIEEPNGTISLSYDALGRVVETARTIEGETAVESREISTHGRLLGVASDDGFSVKYSYDKAGRLVYIDDLWKVLALDASGRVLAERFANGVEQHYSYDPVGRTAWTRVTGPGQALWAELSFAHTAWGAVAEVSDLDGVGVNHSAAYQHDQAGRLTFFKTKGYSAEYSYDALQNMTSRVTSGIPDAWSGDYHYGEGGAGPRQLTSVGSNTLDYDAAGRVVRLGQTTLDWDGFERLSAVSTPEGWAVYDYGADGERSFTLTGVGSETRRFSVDHERSEGEDHHYVRLGDRTLARVTQLNPLQRTVRFHHPGVGVGPALISDEAGALMDERRYEPFGAVIEASVEAEPLGWGNKPVDPLTGWSDHGARWQAPAVGRWLSPDPPVKAPDPAYLSAPWRLHPYQYVRNSPMAYWDPDGREERVYVHTNPTGTTDAGYLDYVDSDGFPTDAQRRELRRVRDTTSWFKKAAKFIKKLIGRADTASVVLSPEHKARYDSVMKHASKVTEAADDVIKAANIVEKVFKAAEKANEVVLILDSDRTDLEKARDLLKAGVELLGTAPGVDPEVPKFINDVIDKSWNVVDEGAKRPGREFDEMVGDEFPGLKFNF